jgi:hypothetical protein
MLGKWMPAPDSGLEALWRSHRCKHPTHARHRRPTTENEAQPEVTNRRQFLPWHAALQTDTTSSLSRGFHQSEELPQDAQDSIASSSRVEYTLNFTFLHPKKAALSRLLIPVDTAEIPHPVLINRLQDAYVRLILRSFSLRPLAFKRTMKSLRQNTTEILYPVLINHL